jgi:hypothetical protein
MVYGLWFMVYGLWFMVYGLWFMVYGLWFMVYGLNYYQCDILVSTFCFQMGQLAPLRRGVTHHCRTGRWEAHIWAGKSTYKPFYLSYKCNRSTYRVKPFYLSRETVLSIK